MPKKDKSDISCNIRKTYGYLNEKENKVFALVSWNDNDPKFDIRKCYEKDGKLVLASGISLSEEEMEQLVELWKNRNSDKVDFQDIFDSSIAIEQNRKNGFRTEDGFIQLHRRKGK